MEELPHKQEKPCSKCHEVKPFSEFRKSSKGDKNGLHSWCYHCNREARRRHYQKNKQKYSEWNKSWNERNQDKRREYEENRVKTYTYSDWIALPGRREQKRAYDHNYRAKKKSADGVLTKETVELIFSTYGKACLRCGSTENIEIDHVVPLSLGGSNLFENLQPLCRTHNSAKGNRSCADYRGDGRTTA